MMRTSILMVLAAASLAGCKGETKVEKDPQMVQDLTACKDSLAEKDKRISALQDENANLMRGSGAGKEITVVIEGNALTVKPSGGSNEPAPDDKVAAAASKEFLNVVAKSRGAIQKCYEQALKKNAAPQGRTITLTVSASFSQAGSYRDASFAPSLGEAFDSCIKTVASTWALPQNSPAMTFKAQGSLTPS